MSDLFGNHIVGFPMRRLKCIHSFSDQAAHKCNRVCEDNQPMTCEYNFTIENYFVLSKVGQRAT